MKKNHHFLLLGRILLLAALLSACSPLNPSNYTDISSSDAPTICSDEQSLEDRFIPVESEQDLKDELAGLEQSGDWSIPENRQQSIPTEVVYDFPVTLNKQVEYYLDLFQNKQRKYFKRWLARSSKYLPHIRRELADAGLPQDLAYLAMIESGYNPSAYSHAHAAGLWQFIRGTGRNYGLRIDSWIDERRDPEKATGAAVAYLSALYDRFGDWQLAVAGYNAGEGKIERAILKYNSRDFWELARHSYLRLETKRYVPKLIAAIILARNPEKYGFTDIAYQKPVQYDTIKVPGRTDLRAVAASGSTTVKKLRKLNNELNKNQTPPSSDPYELKIPNGSYDLIAANLSRLHPVVTTDFKTHKVCKGETIGRISKRYRISMTTLLKANNLHSSKLLIGQRLRIPYQTTKYVLLKEGQTAKEYYASAAENGRMVLHEMRRGETLSKIGKQYNVPVDLLIQWNNIDDVRRVRAGQQVAIYLDRDDQDRELIASSAVPDRKKAIRADTADKQQRASSANGTDRPELRVSSHGRPEKVISLADSKKRRPGSSPQDGQRIAEVSYYKVRNGDSLWTIARKFQVSARDLRRWNGLRNNMIHPGEKLIIKNS